MSDRDDLARLLEQHPAYSTGNDQQDLFKAREAADAILAAGWVPTYKAMEAAVAAGEAVRVECNRRTDALAAAVDRVRALHSQDDSLLAPGKWCPACGDETPCPTIRALAAESSP